MSNYIYTFRCTNGACRNIEKTGIPHTQIKCPQCGHQMNKIKTEKS